MKKNFVPSHLNSNNHKKQANRKSRSLQIEALENRHLLSAASIMQTAIANDQVNDTDACKEVNQNTFTVQSNLDSNYTDKVVAVYIQGNSDATFKLKDGDSATILSQVRDSENQEIACLLVKMGAKSSFTLTTDAQLEGPMTVFVTHPLDLNGDGQGTEQEYYQVQGSYLNSLGMNQRMVAMFYKQHGIDLTTLEVPTIFDQNSDGKIDQNEWQLAANIQDASYQISPTITTTPQIENLEVAGDAGTPVPGQENRFVSNVDPSTVEEPAVTFTLPESENLPVKVVIEYVDAEGNEQTLTEEDAQGPDVSIPLEGGLQPNSTVTITFSYNGMEESETTYTYVFDSVAPALDVASQLTSDYNVYEGMVYTNDPTPEFLISPSGEIDWDAVLEEASNPDKGIWLVVEDDQTEVFRKKLTNSDLTKIQNGEFFVTLPRLANGCHTLSFYTKDLAGNQTAGSQEVLTIDTVKPVVAAEGHNVNYGTNSMYVETSTTPLEITVTDENLMITDPDGCVTMTSDRGGSAEPTETGVTDSSIQYTYSLHQSYGTNVWTFTVVDAAGNQSVKTFTYDYNKPPQVTNKGTKLQDADVRLTTDSTTASDYESQQAVGTVTDGKLNLGKVADLFKEVDGSSIVADKNHVSIENLGDAVASWDINDQGEIVLTLASFNEGETATFVSEGITVTYTDEYDKSADISFDLKWTNDTEAPVATLNENDALVDKAEDEYYYTGTDPLEMTFTFTDFNTVEEGTIYVYGADAENPEVYEKGDSDQVTVQIANPVHNQAYTIKYSAKDNFGNEIQNATICTIFVDQQVDVEAAEFAFSGVNERDTDSTPSFAATFDSLEEPVTLVLYCDGTEVASVEVAADATSAEITSSELPEDGIYTFTAELKDAAGNTFAVTPEDGLVYYFDTTAPTVAVTNEAEDSTGVTDSAYTLTLDTQDAVSGVASIEVTQSYTDEEGNPQTKTYSSTKTFDSCDVTLFYGVNTFTYTATDAAGNTSEPSAEFSVVFNTAPTAQGAFYNENEQKFAQTLSKSLCDENEQIRLDLANYFDDEVIATLTGNGFTITGNGDQDTAVSACSIEEGFLVFTMTPGMEQGEPDRFSNVSFTLVDEFGKELAVSFDVTYLFDSFAPTIEPENLTVTASEDGNVTKNTDSLYFLTGDEIHITATITDDTGIETCGWSLSKIVGEEVTVVASGETADVSYDETGVEEGAQFVLTAWGKDTLVPANESTAEEPSCTYQFCVDNTAPTAESEATLLDSTGEVAEDQTLIADNQPRVAYEVQVNDMKPECCTLSIYLDGELLGDNFDFTGTLTNDTTLTDGVHRYTFKVVDGAGNESEVYSLIEFVVDTTAPVWTVTEVANADNAEEGDYGFLFLDENDTVEFNLEVEDNVSALEDVKFQYSTDEGETWTDYVPGDAVALEFGTKTFQFKAIDEAGNESISDTTIDVSYDHTPTVTRATLAAKDPIGFVEDQTEYTVYFTASEISALFDDADLENGDVLTFTCNFEGAEGVVTGYTWQFRNGVWNLKLTVDPEALKQSHTFGTLTSFTATDTFDQSAVKQVNLAIEKANLAPEQVKEDTLTDTQKLEAEPSYTFDLTDYFADPEGDTWTISAATINGDECAIDGKEITWTPSSGLYGNTTLEITVKDQFNAETSTSIDVLIEWAGVQSVAARNQTVEENAAAQEVAVTIENAFDAEQAWGDYSCEMTNGVSIKSETVYGNTVDNDHVQTPIETLFADYNFTGSTLTYSLNPYAYGEGVLTLNVNGVTKDVTITVTNVPCDPYAPDQTGSFTLTSTTAQEYNVLAQCNTDTDSGTLALTSVNDNKTAITIFRDDKVYTLNLAVTEDGFTLTRGTIDGNAGTSEEWEALHGSTIVIPYEIQNTDTECTNTGNFIVKLNAIAKSVTKSYRRSDADEYYEIPLSEFTDFTEDGFKVVNLSFVRGSQDVSAGVNSEGGVGVSITAGCDVDTVYEYMLSNGTTTYYAQLYISIDGYNWAPELKPGIPTSIEEPEREPDATTGYVVYDCPIGDIFVDPVDNTDLTIMLVGGTITDARTGEVYEDEDIADFGFGGFDEETGVIWFSPFDKDFYGTIQFTVAVTDGPAGTKQAAPRTSMFTFTATITNTADAPKVVPGADLVLSGNPGDVFDLSEEVGKFFSPDGDDTLEVVYGDSTTYTIPEDAQFGSYTIEVTVNDTTNGLSSNFEYTVVVSGSAMITDDSLDVTKQKETTIRSGVALADNKTLDQNLTLTAEATLATGSVLKAGTVLSAGTKFAKSCTFQSAEEQSWFATYDFEEEDGEYGAGGAVTIQEDILLTADITITSKSIAAADGSMLAAGTVAAEGSKFGQTFTITETVADVAGVKKIYQASKKVFELTGDRFVLLRDEISISVADPDAISTVTNFSAIGGAVQYVFDSEAEGNDYYTTVDFSDGSTTERIISIVDPQVVQGTISPFRFVTYDSETGKFYAYYTPYDSTQDRSAQTTVLTINGEDVNLTLSIDYEMPFEVCYTLAKGTDTRLTATSIAAGEDCEFVDPTATLTEGENYTVQMWVKCNLPLLSEELLAGKPYGAQSFIETAYFSLSNVTNVGTYGPQGATESTYEDGVGKLKLGVVEPTAGKDFNTETYQVMYLTFTAGENCTLGAFTHDLESSTYSLVLDNENVSGIGACGGVNPETGLPDASEGVHLSATQVKTRTLNPNAVKGTSAAKETVVEGNGIYMSFVKEKSNVEVSDTLPKSDAYITEWEGGFLELWVNTQEVETDIANFKFDVNYNSSLYTATGIEYGTSVSNAGTVTFGNGAVCGITGTLTDAVTTEDGFVLVGRIQLTPVQNGGIAAQTIGTTSLGLSLENIELRDSAGFWLDVNTQTVVNTKALAVMYDANDDGDIDIDDLVLFAQKFGTNTVVSTDSLAWALDFDNNGLIDVQDLVFFARNFGATQANGAKIYYPDHYFQIWIGTTLEMSGDSNISDTLESALDSWSEKLGEELNLDVQIIVKEYANEVNGTLAEASLLGCDENGKPNTAVIYLDSDALGMGWYVGKDAEVQAEQYDLYTVLLHELGHALGMTTNYSGYNEFLNKNVKSSNYRDEAGNMHVIIGSHVYDENDLMTEAIDVGVRREISDVDAEIVKATRAYGGVILGKATDSILGISAAVEGVTFTETEASAIMPEAKFNQILLEAATQAVLEASAKRTDLAWQELESGENVETNLSGDAADEAFDSLFGEDFSNLTGGTIREDLKVEPDEE